MVNRERSGVAVGFISFAGIVLILAGVFHARVQTVVATRC